jgi:hypothetical protein
VTGLDDLLLDADAVAWQVKPIHSKRDEFRLWFDNEAEEAAELYVSELSKRGTSVPSLNQSSKPWSPPVPAAASTPVRGDVSAEHHGDLELKGKPSPVPA